MTALDRAVAAAETHLPGVPRAVIRRALRHQRHRHRHHQGEGEGDVAAAVPHRVEHLVDPGGEDRQAEDVDDAGQRDQRHAHGERVAARRATVVGKGIEGDVELVIERVVAAVDAGVQPHPVERVLRDARINLIIEGTTEIMHLFIAREAMDPHLKRILPLISGRSGFALKVSKFLEAFAHYGIWYQFLDVVFARAFGQFGDLFFAQYEFSGVS